MLLGFVRSLPPHLEQSAYCSWHSAVMTESGEHPVPSLPASPMSCAQVGERTLRPWLEVCAEDSDGDGYSNGAELGDPCCIYRGAGSNAEPTGQVAWSWRLTHPGQDGAFPQLPLKVPLTELPPD